MFGHGETSWSLVFCKEHLTTYVRSISPAFFASWVWHMFVKHLSDQAQCSCLHILFEHCPTNQTYIPKAVPSRSKLQCMQCNAFVTQVSAVPNQLLHLLAWSARNHSWIVNSPSHQQNLIWAKHGSWSSSHHLLYETQKEYWWRVVSRVHMDVKAQIYLQMPVHINS